MHGKWYCTSAGLHALRHKPICKELAAVRQPEVRVNDGDEFALSQQLHALQEVRSCVATDSGFVRSCSGTAQMLRDLRYQGAKATNSQAARPLHALRRAVPYVAMLLRILWSCMPCASGRDDNETKYKHAAAYLAAGECCEWKQRGAGAPP